MRPVLVSSIVIVLTRVIIRSVRLLVSVLDKPVEDPSHKWRDQSHTGLCTCHCLEGRGGEGELEGGNNRCFCLTDLKLV